MIFEKIEALCTQHNISVTALCKEITGSSGNLPTWKKDSIKAQWIKAICEKFNISSDFLLDINVVDQIFERPIISEDETDLLSYFRGLPRKDQRAILVQMENMLDKLSDQSDQTEVESKKSLA